MLDKCHEALASASRRIARHLPTTPTSKQPWIVRMDCAPISRKKRPSTAIGPLSHVAPGLFSRQPRSQRTVYLKWWIAPRLVATRPTVCCLTCAIAAARGTSSASEMSARSLSVPPSSLKACSKALRLKLSRHLPINKTERRRRLSGTSVVPPRFSADLLHTSSSPAMLILKWRTFGASVSHEASKADLWAMVEVQCSVIAAGCEELN